MARRLLWTASLGLVVLGLALRFVVVPGMKIVPGDLSVVRTYEGTLLTMLDPATFELYQDLPVCITRTLRVEEVQGDGALLYELAELHRQDDGKLIQSRETRYALDRRSLLPLEGLGEDWPREGYTVNLAFDTQKQDYEAWNEDAQRTARLSFVREEKVAGLRTFVFNMRTGPDAIRDPFMLNFLPAEVDKATLWGLVDQMPLTEQQRELATELLPDLPDPVPLNYAYISELTLWVEPTTGMAVDLVKHEKRVVLLGLLPVATVFEMDWRHTPATVRDVVDEISPLVDQARLFGHTLPLLAWATGAALVVFGWVVSKLNAPAGDQAHAADHGDVEK
jgi:hypothetical protein